MTAETLYAGRFLRLVRRGAWEFAERTNAHGIVVIVAVTREGELVLIEQERPPVGGPVIELPAGLAGDGAADEALADAAARELLEETGLTCERMEFLAAAPPSPGMVSEVYSMFRAHGVTAAGPGGGVDGEAIVVHRVPLAEVPAFLAAASARGAHVALTVWAGLGLLAVGARP